MGIRIDALDAAASAQADHEIPAMRANQTVKLTAEQLATFIIAIVTDSAPATLDTLNELAAALGDDPNFATTVTNSLATKASLTGSETLTNKTLTTPIVDNPQLTLVQSSSPTPTAEGRIEWDTNDDKLVVGNGSGQAIFGQITPWVAYTPTLTGFGTPTGVSFRSRRVGGSLEVFGRFTSGTATAVEARVSIGFDGTDGNVSVNSFMNSSVWPVGQAARSAVGSAQYYMLATGGHTYLRVGLQNDSREGLTQVNGNVALSSSGVTLAFYASIPIEGWS